jgi:hypothetical protein
VGLELARRTVAANKGNEYGPALSRLAGEIEADRVSLLSIMKSLGVSVDRAKVIAGWTAEKIGRLKLNGRLLSYSPLSRVMELELLTLGVTGKRALWRALDQLAPGNPRLDRDQLKLLTARAEAQLQELEGLRERAVAEAFAG